MTELKAEREVYSKVIKSLAAIVMCPQTDEQCELELLPRESVMLEVIRIRQAMDDFMKQARAKLDQKPTSEEYGFVSIYDAEYTLQRGRGASDEQAQFLALREVVKSARATHTTGGNGDD